MSQLENLSQIFNTIGYETYYQLEKRVECEIIA